MSCVVCVRAVKGDRAVWPKKDGVAITQDGHGFEQTKLSGGSQEF